MKKFLDLVKLLETRELLVESSKEDFEILDINYDSRNVKKGTLFFAKGLHFKEEYLDSAIDKGAVAYISEKKHDRDFPYIIVKDIRKAMYIIADYFFDNPQKKLKMIGVTGTKGKSTTVLMLKSILDKYLENKNEKRAGIISTIITYDGIIEKESTLTTPESIELFRHLHNAVISGLKYMIVEVSSQALKYERVGEIKFDIGALLNISSDHIGELEHPTLEDYIEAKLKMIDISNEIIYYKSSEHLAQIENRLISKKSISYDINNENADVKITNVEYKNNINHFKIGDEDYTISMFGDFNVLNACCAIIIAKKLGVDYEIIKETLKSFSIKARSNIFMSNDKKLIVIVDYAHNKLSFEENFNFFEKNYSDFKIYAVFGASGDKGINRRKDLAEVSCLYADKIYLVPDDPDYEDIAEVSKDIASHFTNDVKYEIFLTREAGIKKAFSEANEKTLIYVTGKGDEKYQLINGNHEKINSDYEVALKEIERYNNK